MILKKSSSKCSKQCVKFFKNSNFSFIQNSSKIGYFKYHKLKFCLKKWLAEKSALKFLNLFSFIYHSEFYKFPTVHFCSLIIINHSLRLSSQSLDFLNKKNDKITPLLFCAFSNRWSINLSSNFPIYVKQIEIEYQSFFNNAIQTYFHFFKLQFKQASSVKNQNLKVWNDHNLPKRLLLNVAKLTEVSRKTAQKMTKFALAS